MPAVDPLQEWQRAESACSKAYQAVYAKVAGGVSISAAELEHLAQLSQKARLTYQRYLEQVTATDLPNP